MQQAVVERSTQVSVPLSVHSAAPRLDLYAGIHKAMRAAMGSTLVTLGSADAGDDASLTAALNQLRELISMCAAHLSHENRFVHTAIEARCPGVSDTIADEHIEHEDALEDLAAGVRAVERASDAVRAAVLFRLYQRLALFGADNFVHMNVEETVHNQALWSAYSDAELAEIHGRLVAAIEPAKMMKFLRWIIPSISHVERVGMLSEMGQAAPEGVFEAVLEIAYRNLSQPEWSKLARALGVPQVPGLVRC